MKGLAFILSLILSFCAAADAPDNFREAKKIARDIIWADNQETIYCGCEYTKSGYSGGEVDLNSCGYAVRRSENRAERLEWEHVVPAYLFGHDMQCWKDGGRKNCEKTDSKFKLMEADLFNLYPSVGEINGDRSNYTMTELQGEGWQYGSCDFEINRKLKSVEPRDNVKGVIARTYLYMIDKYNINTTSNLRRIMLKWNIEHPVTQKEIERDARIYKVTGYHNIYITGEGQ